MYICNKFIWISMLSLLLRRVAMLATLLFAVSHLFAYTVYNGCPDLTNLSASYVEAYTGHVWETMEEKGIVEGRHTVISTNGTDPYTDNKLKMIPEGATSVVRLGNDLAEAETDVLVYHFRVDADNPILKLRYAVVMENPAHAKSEQPHFNLQVLDAAGKPVSNSTYEVYASANAAGFHTSQKKGKLGSSIIWCDWTNMGVDLSDKVGQEVQIRITTYDCGGFEHFAYAYFTAECVEKTLTVEKCQSSSVTFSAPEGFASYTWSNGSKERTITIPKNSTTGSVSCIVRSASGSEFVLVGVITSLSNIKAEDYTVTVTTGDKYQVDGITLPTDKAREVIMNYYDPATCAFKVGKKIQINLNQKKPYITVKVGICEGESYEAYGFSYIKPAVGTYRDTLPCKTCTESYPQYYALDLTVSPAPTFPTIKGPQDLCQGESATFQASGGDNITTYQWSVKKNGVEYVGYSSSFEQEFLDAGAKTITFIAGNACQSQTQSIKVNVHPNYKQIYFDTVCVGTKYSEHGFNLGVLQEESNIVRNKTLQTKYGCDSLVVLSLFVAPEVKVRIDLKGDSVLCEDKEIKLTAKGGLDFEEKETPDRILVGDIHCTDGTILHPADYATSGKTADGVVVYLDETGEHGAITNLKDDVHEDVVLNAIEMLYNYGLRNWNETVEILVGSDGDGEMIASVLMDWLGSPNFRPDQRIDYCFDYLRNIDYDNGWYLPSPREYYSLIASLSIINSSLSLAGGDTYAEGNNYISCTIPHQSTPYPGVMTIPGVWDLYNALNKSIEGPYHKATLIARHFKHF